MEMASYVQDEESLGQNCFTFLNKMQRVIFRFVTVSLISLMAFTFTYSFVAGIAPLFCENVFYMG